MYLKRKIGSFYSIFSAALSFFNFGESGYRDICIDVLRSVAIFAVVLVHSLNYLVNIKSNYYEPFFEMSGFWRFCVPFFLIVSGYFSCRMNKMYFLNFLKKIVLKILIPFFIATFLSYYIFWGDFNWSIFWQVLLNGRADYGHWFIPLLLEIYILHFLITRIFKKSYLYVWLILSLISIYFCFNPYTFTQFLFLLAAKFPLYKSFFVYLNNLFISYTQELAQIQFYLVYFGFGLFLEKVLPYFKKYNYKNLLTILFLILTVLFGILHYRDFIVDSWVQRFAYFNGYLALYSINFYIFFILILGRIRVTNFWITVSLLGKHSLWVLLFHGILIKILTSIFFENGVSENYRLYVFMLSFVVVGIFLMSFWGLEKVMKIKS
ncbi:MAG: hypothetical protein UR27_C0005G0037 [Candidatus Peregrinibacteria bacterium GW2011_GWA2_33_10]|nr:MAG: hypothetical protein UR27_C0005G0037 [Candidatus Peregrinibacteria bacterium GW2011_GWA2_33_10]KKP39295.1 MAG: hypothetical protein UR30_C0011G0038 [Candidatus Peregrinibacteria bacterium GW2011_GWC2_33_13]